jgi:hypothetical protein
VTLTAASRVAPMACDSFLPLDLGRSTLIQSLRETYLGSLCQCVIRESICEDLIHGVLRGTFIALTQGRNRDLGIFEFRGYGSLIEVLKYVL